MTEVLSPVGRIVWGNPAKPTVKKYVSGDQKGQPVLKDGQPITQWVFGVAFPIADFERVIWPIMAQEVIALYGNIQSVPAKWSWKYKHGDTLDDNRVPYANREGYAGHYVLTISTEAFAPPIYKFENGQYRQLQPHEIKTGDYVVVKLDIKSNIPKDRTYTPGFYINPQGIELVGYGKEIVNGPDAMAMFGGQQHQLPPGASAQPVHSAPIGSAPPAYGAPQQPQQPQPGYPAPMPPQQPQPGYPAPMPPQQPQPGYPAPMPPQQPQPGYPAPMPPQQPQPGYPAPMPPQQPQPGYPAPMPPQQPQPGYPAPMPPQQPQPGYPAPMPPQQPQPGYPAPMPPQQPQPGYPAPMQGYPPMTPAAHDFVHGAGQQPPMPGMMPPR